VGVQQVNSFIIYVVGKVNNPNNFLLNARVNVLQALAMAGGLNQYAEKNQVRIFREQSNETIVFYFDYDKVSQGKNLEQNILLQRGDVIVVR
jgi:polysaccharide export outer membrane protein